MNEDTLHSIAEAHETPVYVTDSDIAIEQYTKLQENLTDFSIRFATKANFDPIVVSALHKEGAEFVCGSAQEAKMLNETADIPASDLQVTAVSPKESSITQLLELASKSTEFTVTINDYHTVTRLVNNGFKGNFLLRLKATESDRDDSKYANGSYLKFGMSEQEISHVLEYISDSSATLKGFHSHLGGSIDGGSVENFCEHIQHTIEKTQEFVSLSEIDVLNFGGGLTPDGMPDKTPIDLQSFSDCCAEELPSEDIEYVLEPGRYITGPASILLTRAKTIRSDSYGNFVGVDAGMSEFPRTTMFDVTHPITVVSADDESKVEPQTIAGPTCSGADIFCHNRELPTIKIDDLIAIEQVGAYGFVMASGFHAYKLPTIVHTDGQVTELSDILPRPQ